MSNKNLLVVIAVILIGIVAVAMVEARGGDSAVCSAQDVDCSLPVDATKQN